MRGPMKMSSMGISQSSIVSLFSPFSLFCRISFLLESSALLARARGRTLVGEELSDLGEVVEVGEGSGDGGWRVGGGGGGCVGVL